ncbi:hypothetical protein F4560_002747 [Saccharothrix ecbatanensis]|uniref:Uncharacterized protein n=1 Tax=Saccharothrix ecbatanensis TaxID=1105145 RepID=A0A7W9M0I3_9PSEU|nr:hypothetical protein [Saccharothrix ecbatanensis]
MAVSAVVEVIAALVRGFPGVPTVTMGAVPDSTSTRDNTAASDTVTARHVTTAQSQTNRIDAVTSHL